MLKVGIVFYLNVTYMKVKVRVHTDGGFCLWHIAKQVLYFTILITYF